MHQSQREGGGQFFLAVYLVCWLQTAAWHVVQRRVLGIMQEMAATDDAEAVWWTRASAGQLLSNLPQMIPYCTSFSVKVSFLGAKTSGK